MNVAIDHLVIASPTLEQGITWSKNTLGITPEPGGKHKGFGTHNVLIGLGPSCYLEIVAPEPNQNKIPNHWIPADSVAEPKLIGWAVAGIELESLSHQHSKVLGSYSNMSRFLDDGNTIEWSMTFPRFSVFDGAFPFFIDWGHTLHPGERLETQAQLLSFTIKHPKNIELENHLRKLDITTTVLPYSSPELEARLQVGEQIITIK